MEDYIECDVFILFVSRMQDKTQLLKQLLLNVNPYWPLGQGIFLLLEWGILDDHMIEYLLSFLHKVVRKIQIQWESSDDLEAMVQKELQEKKELWELKERVKKRNKWDRTIW